MKGNESSREETIPTLVWVANHLEELNGKIGEIWDTYGQKLSALLDAHLKTTVDTKARPVLVFLSKNVAIVYEKQVLLLRKVTESRM